MYKRQAIGLVLIGFLTSIRFDLMGLLFGDILAVDVEDITLVYVGGVAILTILYFIWKSLFSSPDFSFPLLLYHLNFACYPFVPLSFSICLVIISIA